MTNDPLEEKKEYLVYFIFKFLENFEYYNFNQITFGEIYKFTEDFLDGKVKINKTLMTHPIPESILKIFAPKEIDDDKKLF